MFSCHFSLFLPLETYPSLHCCLMNDLSCDCLIEKSELAVLFGCKFMIKSFTYLLISFTARFFILACFQHKKRSVSSEKPLIHPLYTLTSLSAIWFSDCGCTCHTKRRHLHFCLDVLFLCCACFFLRDAFKDLSRGEALLLMGV